MFVRLGNVCWQSFTEVLIFGIYVLLLLLSYRVITYCCQKLIIANRYYISLLFHLKCVAFCFVYFNTHLYSISEKNLAKFWSTFAGTEFHKIFGYRNHSSLVRTRLYRRLLVFKLKLVWMTCWFHLDRQNWCREMETAAMSIQLLMYPHFYWRCFLIKKQPKMIQCIVWF